MKEKLVLIIVSLLIFIIDIKFMINILLNKKYVVDGLSDIKKTDALDSVEGMIKADYTYMFYALLINIIWVIIILIVILVKSNTGGKMKNR
jgi:hypothetical protein